MLATPWPMHSRLLSEEVSVWSSTSVPRDVGEEEAGEGVGQGAHVADGAEEAGVGPAEGHGEGGENDDADERGGDSDSARPAVAPCLKTAPALFETLRPVARVSCRAGALCVPCSPSRRNMAYRFAFR